MNVIPDMKKYHCFECGKMHGILEDCDLRVRLHEKAVVESYLKRLK